MELSGSNIKKFLIFCYISGNKFISPTLLLFVRHFIFVLLYRECYGFERAFFTLRHFLPYTPSPRLPQYCKCYGFERAFSTLRQFLPYTSSRHLEQPAFIKASMGASNSSLKIAGSPTEVANTDPAHLFV